MLLSLRKKRTAGIFFQEGLKFGLGLDCLRVIPVGLFHLAVMRHRDLQLGVRRFIEEREERDEIPIFDDGLASVLRFRLP